MNSDSLNNSANNFFHNANIKALSNGSDVKNNSSSNNKIYQINNNNGNYYSNNSSDNRDKVSDGTMASNSNRNTNFDNSGNGNNDNRGTSNSDQILVTDAVSNQSDQLLNAYIYDYLIKAGLTSSSKAFFQEANIPLSKNGEPVGKASLSVPQLENVPKIGLTMDSPSGFLLEWWEIFWDIFNAKNKKSASNKAHLYYSWEHQKRKNTDAIMHSPSPAQNNIQPQYQQPSQQFLKNGQLTSAATKEEIPGDYLNAGQQGQNSTTNPLAKHFGIANLQAQNRMAAQQQEQQRQAAQNQQRNIIQSQMMNGNITSNVPPGIPLSMMMNSAINDNHQSPSSPHLSQIGNLQDPASMNVHGTMRQDKNSVLPDDIDNPGSGLAKLGNDGKGTQFSDNNISILRDYQLQLILLEKQNKKNLEIFRTDKSENGSDPVGNESDKRSSLTSDKPNGANAAASPALNSSAASNAITNNINSNNSINSKSSINNNKPNNSNIKRNEKQPNFSSINGGGSFNDLNNRNNESGTPNDQQNTMVPPAAQKKGRGSSSPAIPIQPNVIKKRKATTRKKKGAANNSEPASPADITPTLQSGIPGAASTSNKRKQSGGAASGAAKKRDLKTKSENENIGSMPTINENSKGKNKNNKSNINNTDMVKNQNKISSNQPINMGGISSNNDLMSPRGPGAVSGPGTVNSSPFNPTPQPNNNMHMMANANNMNNNNGNHNNINTNNNNNNNNMPANMNNSIPANMNNSMPANMNSSMNDHSSGFNQNGRNPHAPNNDLASEPLLDFSDDTGFDLGFYFGDDWGSNHEIG